jgi:prefoldin subunit 5
MIYLGDTQAELDRKTFELEQKRAEKQQYQDTAETIRLVYNQLKEKKETIKVLQSDLTNFSRKSFDDFQGRLFEETYQPKLAEVITSYQHIIYRIDMNMDDLNWKITEYENKVLDCNAVITVMKVTINSLKTQIENFFN